MSDGEDLRAALAVLDAGDTLVFRSARSDLRGEMEVVGAGAGHLSAEQTIVITTTLSPRQAEQLAADRGIGAADLDAWRAMVCDTLCWWFVHGRRWTWFPSKDTHGHPDGSRPGPRQDNDPLQLLDRCRELRVEQTHRLSDGSTRYTGRVVVSRPSRVGRLMDRKPVVGTVEALVDELGALREVRVTRGGRTRALIIDEVGAPLRFPHEVDHSLGNELATFAHDLTTIDWALVQTRLVARLKTGSAA
jgi:hypothetical protein